MYDIPEQATRFAKYDSVWEPSSMDHLGTMVTNNIDGCQQDIRQKIAKYIDRNCNLNQEFNFSHPETKLMINRIYNCHFSGAQVWDLFSPGVASFEGAFNRSVKVMAGLPYATHRYLVGNIAGGHIKLRLIKNYLGFIKRIQKSSKLVLRQLYQLVCTDVRTVTGSNLRNILILTNTANVDDLHPALVDNIKYHEVEVDQMWRIGLVRELLDIKYGNLNLPEGWSEEDLYKIMTDTCTN